MRHLILLALLFVTGTASFAQRHCAAESILQQQILNDPSLLQKIQEIEDHTQHFIEHDHGVGERVVITIPIVFNVVYNTTAENLSDARILEQLDVLNKDFRKLNADVNNTPAAFLGLTADCEINFCLATRDPSGNATTGIRRQFTNTTSFSSNDAVKFTAQGGLDAWPAASYLNFWVCDLSGTLLGYAQFPGGAAATDGVVCDYAYTGVTGASAPFNLGRTATHEVGHWLNLRHIWGDANCGNDLVSDTPTQQTSNGGCPTFPKVTCSNGPNGDMFMNYMDYTNDACMFMFTTGQKARVQALFTSGGARASLASSLGCQAPNTNTCGTPSSLTATSITQTAATLNWSAVSGATAYNVQWKLSTSSTWTTATVNGTTYALSGLTAGTTYNYQVQAVCGTTNGTYTPAASFTTLSGGGGGCTDAYETNNTRNTAKSIPTNTTFTAQIATASDVDWYLFGNSSANRNIKVNMTTLPFDYDVKLFRSATQVGLSENPGTADEQIILNNATVSTNYTVNVYGYGGVSSNTQCYTLRVSLSSTAWRTDGSTDGDVTELEIPIQFGEEGFAMYPNPANEALTVAVSMVSDENVTVSIMDATGKTAIQQTRGLSKGNNTVQMDLSRLASGIYFVQVRNGQQSSTRKLVVE